MVCLGLSVLRIVVDKLQTSRRGHRLSMSWSIVGLLGWGLMT